MKTKNKTKGMFWHCHHDIICEYVYDYKERVDYIKKEKPKDEVEIRLRLFKPVQHPEKLPKEFVEAEKKFDEAWKKYDEAWKKFDEAREKYLEAREKLDEAGKKFDEAREKYDEAWKKYKPQIEKLHAEECGCSEWYSNEEEIIFK